MTTRSTAIVLVHGAWRDGRAWRGVAEHLRAHDFTVHTPTVAGHGPDAATGATMSDAVDSLVDYIEDNELSDVVLVGHSLGGVYVTQTAPRIADRLRGVVFMTAFVLSSGECVYDVLPPQAAAYFREATVEGTITQSFDRVRDKYLSSLDESAALSAYREMNPQVAERFTARVDQSGFDAMLAAGEINVSYIDVTGDVVMGAEGWYARFNERLGSGVRVVTIDGESHEVTYTNPKRAAEAIIEASGDRDG